MDYIKIIIDNQFPIIIIKRFIASVSLTHSESNRSLLNMRKYTIC